MADKIEKWKPERKEGFLRFIEKYFKNEISKEHAKSIPHYFIDSIEARKKDSHSNNELCYLLAWAGQLKSIQEELPTIKVKVGNPVIEKKVRLERGGTYMGSKKRRNKRSFRTKRTAWKEIPKSNHNL